MITHAFDPITQDIGPDGRHLAPSIACIAATLGEFSQAVRQHDQALGQAAGGVRVECFDIGDDHFKVSDRIFGPDDFAQAG